MKRKNTTLTGVLRKRQLSNRGLILAGGNESLSKERTRILSDAHTLANFDNLITRGRKNYCGFLALLKDLWIEIPRSSRNLLEMKGLSQLQAILNYRGSKLSFSRMLSYDSSRRGMKVHTLDPGPSFCQPSSIVGSLPEGRSRPRLAWQRVATRSFLEGDRWFDLIQAARSLTCSANQSRFGRPRSATVFGCWSSAVFWTSFGPSPKVTFCLA